MKKSSILARVSQLKARAELEEINDAVKLEVIDLLLEYINDPDIRAAIEEVAM